MHAGNNSKRAFIARNCTRTVGLTAANIHTTLAPGEILVLDDRGNVLATAAAAKVAKGITIFQGTTDGGVIKSDLIRAKDVKRYWGTKFVQTSEKKAAFGYNGTAGTIDLIDANNYMVTIEHKGESGHSNANPFIHTVGYTSALTGVSQYDIAKGLADVAVLNYSQFDNAPLAYVISDFTIGVAGITGVAVTTGSPVASYTAGAPVVGNVVSVLGLTGTPYGDEPNTVYEIVAVDTVNKIVTFDRAYQHASQTATTLEVIADPTADAYGFIVEGTLNPFKVGFGSYIKDNFFFEAKESGTTTITTSGTGFDVVFGTGRHEQVSIDEFMYQGYEGRNLGNEYQFHNPIKETITGNGYGAINISYESRERINTLETNGQPKEVVIYTDRTNYQDIADSAAGTAYGTNVIDGDGADTTVITTGAVINILNAFMVGAGVIATGLNTTANSGLSLAGDGVFSAGIDF